MLIKQNKHKMKYLKQTQAIIFYGARLLHNGRDVSNEGLARKMQDLSSMLGDFVGEKFMGSIENCGIDVDDMYAKALSALMANGSKLFDESATRHDKLKAEEAIIEALKDDDEEKCSNDEMKKIAAAKQNFLGCLGADNFLDLDKFFDNDLPILEEIKKECKEMSDLTSDTSDLGLGFDMLEDDSALGKASKRCLQTVLADNEIGNFIRHIYDHLDEAAVCFQKLGDELPHCYVNVPAEDGIEFKLPMSLEKKLDCLSGVYLEESSLCNSTFEALDKCLPEVGAAIDDEIPSKCVEEGALVGKSDLLGMDSSVLTQNKLLPDYCSKTIDDAVMKEVKARMNYYNSNRVYGWTAKREDPEAVTQAQALASGLTRVELSDSSQESTVHTFLPLVLLGVAAVVVAAVLILTRSRSTTSRHPPRSAFLYPEFDEITDEIV